MKDFYALNDLSPYTIKYNCGEDCRMTGCPEHIAKLEYFSASDTYKIEFDGEVIYLDNKKFAIILDFAEKLTE